MSKTTKKETTMNTKYHIYVTRNGDEYIPQIISIVDGDASTASVFVTLPVAFSDYQSAYAAAEEVKPLIVNI